MADNYLIELSEALDRSAADRREKQKRALDAIRRAESRVPLTDKALEVIARVNRLQELKTLGSSYSLHGCENDEQASELEHSIVVLSAYLNGLESYSNGLE